MKYSKLILIPALFIISFAFSADKKAFTVFTDKGKSSSYEKLLKEAKGADIILFGELHNNPICHWLELELTKDLYADKKEKLMLGAEMFEADNQTALNDYLSGKTDEKGFKETSRQWPNYPTDYKPLVDFAKENKLAFIADNIPRRYATMVYKHGTEALDTIPAMAKNWIVPLPFKYDPELKCYKDIFASAGGHGGQNLPKSQAIKDATMAYFILKNYKAGQTFIHYNGAYHSNEHQGIEYYLKLSKPNLKIFTISSVEQNVTDTLSRESKGLANYIICIPESMTKTY